MIIRTVTRSLRPIATSSTPARLRSYWSCANYRIIHSPIRSNIKYTTATGVSCFHTTTRRDAQSPTADALMENLNELYATAKDEFEIAAEETEKKTVYAQDDRDAAREALIALKEAFAKATKESDPNVAKEVEKRSGHRIRELEHAIIAMEESAMEE